MLRSFAAFFVAALTVGPAIASAAELSMIPNKLDVQWPVNVRITLRYVGGGLHDPISAHQGTCTGVSVKPQSLVHARRIGRYKEWELMQAFTVSVQSQTVRGGSCDLEFKAGSLRTTVPVMIKPR